MKLLRGCIIVPWLRSGSDSQTVVFHRFLIGVFQGVAVIGFCDVEFYGVVDSRGKRSLVEATGPDEVGQEGLIAFLDGLGG